MPEKTNETAGRLRENRGFITLMGAQLISNLGEWLYIVALLTLVGLQWHATPWEITMMTLCLAVPLLIGGPVAGVIGDRFDRKKLMILADIARIFIMIGLLFAGTLWHVYVLLVLKSLMDVLFSPAKTGKIKEIVPKDHMDLAVTVSSSIEQLMKVIGPALGGLVMAMFSIQSSFVFTAGAFLVSALLLIGVPGSKKAVSRGLHPDREEKAGPAERLDAGGAKASFLQEMKAGLNVIMSIPMLLSGLVTLCAVLLVLQMADTQTVTLFRIIPGVSEDLLGYCISASGIGTLLAAMVARKVNWSTMAKMASGAVLLGLVFAAAGAAVVLPVPQFMVYMILFTAFFLAGAGAGFVLIPFQMLAMKRTPEHLTSRVFGTIGSMTSAAVIVGPLLGGLMVTYFGPVATFIVSGLGTALLGLGLMLLKGWVEQKDVVSSALDGPSVPSVMKSGEPAVSEPF